MRAARHEPRPPVLLADASWYGTLAAARSLGGRGVSVTLAVDAPLPPARFSRHVTRTVPCPPTRETRRFLEWILDFGTRHPGHVLYPTSDDLAWMIASRREEFASRFLIYSPPLESLRRLLDKRALAAECAEAGLLAPETHCPTNDAGVARVAREATFPVLVKPRMQVMLEDWTDKRKGVRVERREDLLDAWRACRGAFRYDPEVGGRVAGIELPVVQTWCAASPSIYTVDGFIDETGAVFEAMACLKILQLPRGSGAGICFEDAPLDAGLARGLRRLLANVGFHGVFDAEFLIDGDRRMLIDLNPRFYNHMAYEEDRGLPLAWLAYLAAVGAGGSLQETLVAARDSARPADPVGRVYVHRLPTELLAAAQTLTGGMARGEREALRRWLRGNAANRTDPAWHPTDPLPGLADIAAHLVSFARHPRAFVRHLTRTGA